MPSQDFIRNMGAPRQQPQTLVTPTAPDGGGVSQTFVDAFRRGTMEQQSQIQANFQEQMAATAASTAAQRAQLADRRRFGLAGIGLQREGLGLDRQDLDLSRQEAGLDRRDAMEAVINNALQRGIFRSGIRLRNIQRAEERADITDERLNLAGGRLDLRGRQLDLSAAELQSSIKHALAALNAGARESEVFRRQQMEAAMQAMMQGRAQELDERVMQHGPIYSDAPVSQPIKQAFTGYVN